MSGPRAEPRLLERDDELATLSELLTAARNGDGAVAVVEGPPGIGKTRLLGALTAGADEAGVRVLTARGGELEQGFAFGVARQLFEAPVAAAATPEREELLSGAAALAAPLIDAAVAPYPALQPPTDPFPLLHGLYWLCANLAERAPLAIVVDDAHWADGPSLRWLHYLSRRLEGMPALVALAARSTEPEAPVEPIEAMKAESAVALLRPAALSESASATLLGDVFDADPAPALVREAHRATRGNPFLLAELARSLAAEGVVPDASAAAHVQRATPETIARSALTRLARLPSAVRELARATALLGEDAELRHAAALAQLDEDDALAAADRLAAAGFLEADWRLGAVLRLRFTHPLMRQALYADLHAGERASRHKQAARLLAGEPGSAERAAAHLMETAPAADPWVVDMLGEAAAAALAAGAPEIGTSYLRRALDEPPPDSDRAAVLLALGQAELRALDPAGLAHLEAAADAAQNAHQRGAALGALAFFRFGTGDTGAALAARKALDETPPGDGGPTEAQLLLGFCLPGRVVPELVDEVRSLLAAPRTGPRGEPTAAEFVRLVLASLDALLLGELQTAAELARQAGEHRAQLGDVPMISLGSLHSLLGQHREAEVESERALKQAQSAGSQAGMLLALEGRVYLRWRSGDLAGAIADAETEMRLGEEFGVAGEWDPVMMPVRAIQAVSLLERGDLPAAMRTLDLPAGLEDRLEHTWGWLWLPYARSRLALARSEWVEAHHQALTAGERVEAIQAPSPDYVPWRSLAAQALARQGERDQAAALTHDELDLARKQGSQRATGVALMTLGSVEHGEEGLEALREAVDALSSTPARLEHARALCAFGAALRRANRRTDARDPLQAAIDLAEACGATPLAERAHAELRATGARPRSLVFSGVESLTARERQVAEMAAEGQSNPEIAQALFVTRKTVETHLGSVYRKLRLESREQLAEALAAPRT